MTLNEIMNSGPVSFYGIAVTLDGEYWFMLNGWKISIKKCIGSYYNSNSGYRKIEDFKEVKFLKRTFEEVTEDITPEDISSYLTPGRNKAGI